MEFSVQHSTIVKLRIEEIGNDSDMDTGQLSCSLTLKARSDLCK